jgi:hypothetical protein
VAGPAGLICSSTYTEKIPFNSPAGTASLLGCVSNAKCYTEYGQHNFVHHEVDLQVIDRSITSIITRARTKCDLLKLHPFIALST